MASPKVSIGKTTENFKRKNLGLKRQYPFFNRKNAITQAADSACEIIVATAAPRTPKSKAYMNNGSKPILATAPMITEVMLYRVKPCAVINAFIPKVSWTKIVPMA